MDHFDTVEHDPGTCHRLEAEHGADPALDVPMVLFYPVIEMLALTDGNWFLLASRPVT